jgi:choline-sulfatase
MDALEQDRPDILVLMADQWNPTCLGCEGDPVVRTPNLDGLAAQGTLFEAAYTVSPVCMPARCSFASGLYPHNHGFWSNFTAPAFPADLLTLFGDIQRAGYRVAKIGKFHYFNLGWGEAYKDYDAYYDQLGLDYALELPAPYATPSTKSVYRRYLREKGLLDRYLWDMAQRYDKGDVAVIAQSPVPVEDHNDSYVARKAIEYIQQCGTDRPVFLCVSFFGPHTPFDAPGEYAEMFDPATIPLPPNVPEAGVGSGTYNQEHIRRARANYYGKIALIDTWIGRILDALKHRGKWDNTLVAFVADHGEYLGAHGRFGKGSFFDESARIPLLLHWAGRIQAAAKNQALVQLIDLYPTLVKAAGGQISQGRFGTSLLPLALGETTTVHDAVFSEIAMDSGTKPCFMVRTTDYKWFTEGNREHLYDVHCDPYEMDNLAQSATYRDIASDTRERLCTFLMSTQHNRPGKYTGRFKRTRSRVGEADTAQGLYRLFQSIQE